MFETPFYHGLFKKVIIGFGALFSHVQIQRLDTNGAVAQTVKVPIAYGPKEKHFVRLEQDPNLTDHVYTPLPKLGFEITSYSYDPSRMVNRNNQIRCFKDDGTMTSVQAPVPYNLEISLYALTKGTEDGLAIVEQILPLFAPEYNLNIKAIPGMSIIHDVPIILNGVTVQDDYEGDFQTRRFVTHTFNFTVKTLLYGPVKNGGIITNTDVDVDTETIGHGQQKRIDIGDPTDGSTSGEWIP